MSKESEKDLVATVLKEDAFHTRTAGMLEPSCR